MRLDIWRCRACWRTQHFGLPQVTKKVIYLDQNAISNMMKALNPKTDAHRDGRVDPFWQTLFEKLDTLVTLQLIICPDSLTHSNESRVSTYFQALQRMYEQLSHGVTFHDPDTIERFQIFEHLENVFAGSPNAPSKLDVHSVVSGKINVWTDRIIVTASTEWKPEWVEDLRQFRDQISTAIEEIFRRWQTEKGRTFKDWVEEEVAGFGTSTVAQAANFITVLRETLAGQRDPDPNINPLLPPASVILVNTICERLRRSGMAAESVYPTAVGYLTSAGMKEIPFLKIRSMLWASVARKAANGGKRPPSRGMSNDIKTISTILPYCDAMFVDKECWTYLNEEPLRSELKFGTKLFSLNNKQEFLDYLDSIIASTTPEHLATVHTVYGENCLIPYTSIYSKENL